MGIETITVGLDAGMCLGAGAGPVSIGASLEGNTGFGFPTQKGEKTAWYYGYESKLDVSSGGPGDMNAGMELGLWWGIPPKRLKGSYWVVTLDLELRLSEKQALGVVGTVSVIFSMEAKPEFMGLVFNIAATTASDPVGVGVEIGVGGTGVKTFNA